MPLIADTLTNANTFRELFGVESNSTFDDQAANIFISRNEEVGIIEEYSGESLPLARRHVIYTITDGWDGRHERINCCQTGRRRA